MTALRQKTVDVDAQNSPGVEDSCVNPRFTAALDFLLKYGEEIFPGTPIIFCGIDSREIETRQPRQNMTGEPMAYVKGYAKSSRHYFDAVLARNSGPAYDEVVAITAKYTGASPDLIRKGFPYQDRDGRLMPGDVGRQTAWWYAQKLIKSPIAEKDIVDDSFLREALRGLR